MSRVGYLTSDLWVAGEARLNSDIIDDNVHEIVNLPNVKLFLRYSLDSWSYCAGINQQFIVNQNDHVAAAVTVQIA